MPNHNLQELIDSELAYFAPMTARAGRSTQKQRVAWRAETIRQRQERISLEVFELAGGLVRYGPFKGMKLSRDRWWGDLDLGSQCLGLYEREILSYFYPSELCERPSCFIDIGGADGYYSTGALFSGLVSRAITFEVDPRGRKSIKESWRGNGSPGNLQVFGEATPSRLLDLPQADLEGALILVDVEGAEFDILTPDVLRRFRAATVIIEIHNWVDRFESRYVELLKNASEVSDVEPILPVARDLHHYEELRDFTDDNRLLLISERRPCQMRFLKLSPRA